MRPLAARSTLPQPALDAPYQVKTCVSEPLGARQLPLRFQHSAEIESPEKWPTRGLVVILLGQGFSGLRAGAVSCRQAGPHRVHQVSSSQKTGSVSYGDVLDRVLDRGIVIDAWVRVAVTGIDLVTIEARVVVASIETYLEHAKPLSHAPPLSSSFLSAARPSRENPPARARTSSARAITKRR